MIPTALSSWLGYKVTHLYLTPEGKIVRAWNVLQKIDADLLQMIEDSSSFEELDEKIKWIYSGSSYPSMKTFEYLDQKREELMLTLDMIKKLDLGYYPHIESDVSVLSSKMVEQILSCQKGIDLIKNDSEFNIKWQAYMLEKQLNEIKRELTGLRMQMFLNSTRSHNHYHYHL